MTEIRLTCVLVFCILISSATAANNSAADNSIERLNESMSKGDIKSIIDEARNSTEQLFNQFNNNPDLASMPGLGSMLGFIYNLLQFFFDEADKFAGYVQPVDQAIGKYNIVSEEINNSMDNAKNMLILEKEPIHEAPTPTPVPTATDPHIIYVEIKGTKFNPSELRIAKNTTVRWTNKDSALHVLNGENFKSSPLNKRGMWDYTFNEAGAFEYNCTIHPYMPHGKVIVE